MGFLDSIKSLIQRQREQLAEPERAPTPTNVIAHTRMELQRDKNRGTCPRALGSEPHGELRRRLDRPLRSHRSHHPVPHFPDHDALRADVIAQQQVLAQVLANLPL